MVYCNNAFLRITGYSRKEVIGRNCRFLQGPRTDTATVQRLATALHEASALPWLPRGLQGRAAALVPARSAVLCSALLC